MKERQGRGIADGKTTLMSLILPHFQMCLGRVPIPVTSNFSSRERLTLYSHPLTSHPDLKDMCKKSDPSPSPPFHLFSTPQSQNIENHSFLGGKKNTPEGNPCRRMLRSIAFCGLKGIPSSPLRDSLYIAPMF